MLVAYFVAATGQVPSALELRRFLQERLPEYMVPALFVRLEAFPLTASGKIDRRALPAPERRRDDVSLCVPPRNGIEAAIADVWRELLGLPELGVHDDFFDLGGHSLLGTRVLSRLRGAFGIDLPAAALFRAPTVARLATLVVQRRAEGEGVAELLAAVEGLSDDEVQLRLTAEARHGGTE
jgi:acyl carrier protein